MAAPTVAAGFPAAAVMLAGIAVMIGPGIMCNGPLVPMRPRLVLGLHCPCVSTHPFYISLTLDAR